MSTSWPRVRLGQVMQRVERFEMRDESKEYSFAGTYSFSRGIFVGETKMGSSFQLPRVQRIRAGDFVYCRIMAWEGAFGLVPESADGCVMSAAFVAYEVDRKALEPSFLDWFFKIPGVWRGVGSQSTGTNVRRQSLHPSQLETSEIPLPPLSEQRRIVARIEELSAKIDESRSLRRQAAEEAEALGRAILASDHTAAMTPMRELVSLRCPDVTVRPDERYQFAGVYCFGRGVFRAQERSGIEFAYHQLTTLHTGNFVYPKLMAWEGAFGVVPDNCDGCVVSPEFPVFEVDEARVFPEVLDTHFRSPASWPELSGASTGTNVRRRRLNPQAFLDYRMPLPAWATQERLRQAVSHVDELKQLQAQTSAELDAILPAILDRAFKGEL